MNIVIFFVILLVLVLVHEFGHFFAAKKFGIRVDEFGFGFPPKLFGYKWKETEYTFNLLPIGGFVKIFGEDPNEENINGPDFERSFVHKPKYQQAVVLFAGVFANFLLAWVLFSIGFMSGLPASTGSDIVSEELQNVNLIIVSTIPDSPAENAGLISGDKIISLSYEDEKLSNVNPDNVRSFVISHGNKEIDLEYVRGENTKHAQLIPISKTEEEKPTIGIAMDEIGIAKLPFFTALIEGGRLTLFMMKGTAVGLYGLIRDGLQGRGSFESVTGPVGMVGIVGDAYKFGFVYLLSFSAIISVNLAIINILPFPALDGGRLFFLLIEKIKGSRINPRIVNTMNTIGFGLLIFLMLIITYHDVIKLL